MTCDGLGARLCLGWKSSVHPALPCVWFGEGRNISWDSGEFYCIVKRNMERSCVRPVAFGELGEKKTNILCVGERLDLGLR